jgi:DNA-binding NarL/FixJ family response regulator
MKTIRVLIVDDHPIFLEGLLTALTLRDPGLEVVGTAENGERAIEMGRSLVPDVVLLDIKMPHMSGVEVARIMVAERPEIKIIILTTFDDKQLIKDALRAGAKGYLLKDSNAGQIIEAIKHVSGENVLISGDLALRLSEPDIGSADRAKGSGGVPDRAPQPETVDSGLVGELSPRELEVIRLIGLGKTNGEIGELLFISEKTVRNHISHIYEILNIHTRTKAALWAIQNLGTAKRDK